MLYQFHNLPVHPLVVHAVVVLIPLATLLAILFVIPRTRAWAALPMLLVSVAGLLSAIVARITGKNLKQVLEDNFTKAGGKNWASTPIGKAIADHEGKANWLLYLMIVFTVIVAVVYVAWRRADRFTGVLEYVACGVLVVAALVIVVQVARTGEAGSKAVWNPDGSQSYGSAAFATHLTP